MNEEILAEENKDFKKELQEKEKRIEELEWLLTDIKYYTDKF